MDAAVHIYLGVHVCAHARECAFGLLTVAKRHAI